MPGKSIGIRFDIGYPGAFSRNGDCVIASRALKATDSINIGFGDAVVLNSDNTVSKMVSGTAASFAGVGVREVKQSQQYMDQTSQGYKPGEPVDYITRGSVVVLCRNGTPTAGGSVYLRIASADANKPLGGFEATADGANTVQLTNCEWTTGIMDSSKAVEMTILVRQA